MKQATYTLSCGAELHLAHADITTLAVDAIVNAADERMLGGGGVDGAIHRAAGPELLQACRQQRETSPGVRCPTGQARLTPGFGLPSSFIIHTVGPVYQCAKTSSSLLGEAYRSSLELARRHGFSTIAFPAISCGVYGYPMDEAAGVGIRVLDGHAMGFQSVTMALFSQRAFSVWNAVAGELLSCSGVST